MMDKPLHGNCDAAVNNESGRGMRGQKISYGQALNATGGSVMAFEWRRVGDPELVVGEGQYPGECRQQHAPSVHMGGIMG